MRPGGTFGNGITPQRRESRPTGRRQQQFTVVFQYEEQFPGGNKSGIIALPRRAGPEG